MAGEKVRLASVGLGWWAGILTEAVERSGACEVVTCFARSEDGRKAFAEKVGCRQSASLDEVLNDSEVEGILVATPHSTHTDIICRAASAGKHVFVEKPLTLTAADGKKAYEAARKAGVTLQVGHNRRKQGGNRRLREMIDKGELGMIHQVEGNLSLAGGQNPRQGWRNDTAECPAGAMTGLGVHMVDNLHYLAGPVKRVCAFSKKLLGNGNLDDVTTILMEFEGGPLGYINTTYVVPKICTNAVFGTQANAWTEEEGTKLYFQKLDQQAREELPCEAGDALAEQMAEFARCIREGATPETGGPEGIEVVAVLEAIVESVNTGQVVEVSRFRG
ncbi:MAG: Gfo/Idh/MocA family oxidoreductase [bacterium]